MILSFDKELTAIAETLGIEELDMDRGLKVSMILATVFSKGMAHERERTIRIIQKHAISPMPLVEKIRRPVR